MVFGFFKSNEEKLKQQISKTFDNYLKILKTIPDDEIGFVLDTAAKIKSSSTLFDSAGDYLGVFENPASVDRKYLITTLNEWKKHMIEQSSTLEGRAKSGALSIWFMSAGAFAFPDLKDKYEILWSELQRGFHKCQIFDPDKDIPRQTETDLDKVEELVESREIKYLEQELTKVIQPIIDATNNNLPKKFTHDYNVSFYLSMYAQHCYEKKHNINSFINNNDEKSMMMRMNGHVYTSKATKNVLQLSDADKDQINKSVSDDKKLETPSDEWFEVQSSMEMGDFSKFLDKTKTLWSS